MVRNHLERFQVSGLSYKLVHREEVWREEGCLSEREFQDPVGHLSNIQ